MDDWSLLCVTAGLSGNERDWLRSYFLLQRLRLVTERAAEIPCEHKLAEDLMRGCNSVDNGFLSLITKFTIAQGVVTNHTFRTAISK